MNLFIEPNPATMSSSHFSTVPISQVSATHSFLGNKIKLCKTPPINSPTNNLLKELPQIQVHKLLPRNIQQNILPRNLDRSRHFLQLVLLLPEKLLEFLQFLLSVQHRTPRLHEVSQHIERFLQVLAQLRQFPLQIPPAQLPVLPFTRFHVSTFRFRATLANAMYESCFRTVPSSE